MYNIKRLLLFLLHLPSSSSLIPSQLFNSCTQHPILTFLEAGDEGRGGIVACCISSSAVGQWVRTPAHHVWILLHRASHTHSFTSFLMFPRLTPPACIAEVMSHLQGFHYASQTERESLQKHVYGRSGFWQQLESLSAINSSVLWEWQNTFFRWAYRRIQNFRMTFSTFEHHRDAQGHTAATSNITSHNIRGLTLPK